MSQDPVRDWFVEIHNQLSRMASELGLDELLEAAQKVDLAYRRVYPAQRVTFRVPTGPGQRERMSSLLARVMKDVDDVSEPKPGLSDRLQLEKAPQSQRVVDV